MNKEVLPKDKVSPVRQFIPISGRTHSGMKGEQRGK
jgi:hypothetical protein